MKRVLDITVAVIAIMLFLPFGLVIMLILKFTGEGEIFFLQTRVGKDGKHFKIIKFATMLKASPNMGTGTVTVKNDPRVLPFGKILRKAKLNEVPQFINVLKTDMSLVGPRPMALRDFAYYPPQIQKRLIAVRPGLTGIGSIIFRDEESIMANSSKPSLDCYK